MITLFSLINMAKKSKKKKAHKKGVASTASVSKAQRQPLNKKSPSPRLSADAVKFSSVTDLPQAFVWMFGVFIGSVAILATTGQAPTGYSPDLQISAVFQVGSWLMLTLYFLFLISKKNNCQIIIPNVPLLLPLVAFVLWMTLSLIWATDFYEGFVKVLNWLSGLIIFLLGLMIIRTSQALRILLYCIFISGFLVALLGVSQYLFGVEWIYQHSAPASVFGNKNFAAQYMVFILPLSIFLFISEKDNKPLMWLLAVGGIMMTVFLFYTHTRGSWVSFIGELFFLIAILAYFKFKHHYNFEFTAHKTSLAIGVLIAVGVMFTLTPFTFSDGTMGIDAETNPKAEAVHIESLSGSVDYLLSAGSTLHQRTVMWLNTLALIKDNLWLGTGIGGWKIYYPKYQAAVENDTMLVTGFFHNHTHNDYLEFISELGLIGTLIMLWIAFALLRTMGRLLNAKILGDSGRIITLAPLISIIGISMLAIPSSPLQKAITIMFAMIYCALLSETYWHTIGDKARFFHIRLPNVSIRLGILIALILLLVTSFSIQRIVAESEQYRKKTIIAMTLGKSNAFGNAIKKALEVNPLRKDFHMFQGHYYFTTGDYVNAVKQYETLLQSYPYITDPLKYLYVAYMQVNRPDDAQKTLEHWQKIQPHSIDANYQLAKSYYTTGKYQEAYAPVKYVFSRYGQFKGYAKNVDNSEKRLKDLLAMYQTAKTWKLDIEKRLNIKKKPKKKGKANPQLKSSPAN